MEADVFTATEGAAVLKQIELLLGGPRLASKLTLVSLFPFLI